MSSTIVKIIEKGSKKVIFLQHGPHVQDLEIGQKMILANSKGVDTEFEIWMITYLDTYEKGKLKCNLQNIFVI